MTAALVFALSVPFLFLFAARPLVRRLAIRSMVRRPVELALVVVGSMLATAILTGSLLVGDTIDRSIRASAYEQLGPIDVVVAVSGVAEGERLWSALADFSAPDVDGVLPMLTAGAAVAGLGEAPLVQPVAQLVEIDFAEAAVLGGDPGATGITGPTPASGQAAVTEDLAAKVRVGPGDDVVVYAYGTSLRLEVDRVLPRRGVAGFWLAPGQSSYNVFVTPGTIAGLWEASPPVGAEPPTTFVAVSNVGGVEGGAAATPDVVRPLEEAVAGLPAGVRPVKQDVLEGAERFGSSLRDLYFTVGMFAVAAGILLLVNIFVMLADERRQELGMMRALGLRRTPMVSQFAAEGWVYALASAAVGSVAGIGVGWVIAWRSGQIVSAGREVDALRIEFAFEATSVAQGFAIGFLISLLTILVTSTRIARLNVIGAIRDLPEMRSRRPRRRWGAVGSVAAAAGAAWTAVAVAQPDSYGVLLGPVLATVGLVILAVRRVAPTTAITAAGSFALLWALLAIPLLGWLDVAIDIPMFLAQGLTLVAAAVTVVTVHQGGIGRAAARLGSRSHAIRLGLAYPLAHRFRTAITVAMVSIVVLTLTYISAMSAMFEGQAERLTEDLSGGFDVVVRSNPGNPAPAQAFAAVEGVTGVAPLGRVVADFVADDGRTVPWPVSGFDERLLDGGPPALVDLGAHPTEEAAWRAVLEDPNLIIADEFFLVDQAGPPTETVRVGDTLVMVDPLSGRQAELTVTALGPADMVGNGVYLGISSLRDVFAERAVISAAMVASGNPDEVAERMRIELVAHGLEADTVESLVETMLALNTAFFTLMQQFVGAGLVIGMAGIGVIMVRAVRERRREIGVLRSLGVPTTTVSATFIVEALFVSVQSVLIGVSTALVASYGLTTSGAGWAENLEWAVPGVDLVVIVTVTVVSSLLAALWPARAAARTTPAVALRMAD